MGFDLNLCEHTVGSNRTWPLVSEGGRHKKGDHNISFRNPWAQGHPEVNEFQCNVKPNAQRWCGCSVCGDTEQKLVCITVDRGGAFLPVQSSATLTP